MIIVGVGQNLCEADGARRLAIAPARRVSRSDAAERLAVVLTTAIPIWIVTLIVGNLGAFVHKAAASAFVLARQIARPVQQLARATRRVQDGDYSVEIPVTSRDEIGMLSQAFRNLVEDLKEKAQLVEYMMHAATGSTTQPLASAPTAIRRIAERPAGSSGGELLQAGSIFAGRYEVKEVLGAGGMGVVYRAFDRELGELVAIKTLRPDTVAGDPVALERFKQEIRLARKIAHRNVVRTYDLGEVDGQYYLTMEYVEGTSLKALIESRGRLPAPVTLTIGKQLCRALEVAHEQGVIHRDIKPQNIVVGPGGFLKVMDFGIARLANPPKGKGLTQAGMAIGTPDYMSPEQLSGMELDPRSDLYSTGVVLFIPLIIYQNLVLPSYILPSAQALGIWGRVTQFFNLAWFFFDMGTSTAFMKYLSQHRVDDPKRGIQYGQVFVWWQALSGAVQVALIIALSSTLAPRSVYALYAWSVIIHSFIQIPGFYQVFKHSLTGFQRLDYSRLLEVGANIIVPFLVQPILVTLMFLWGKAHPIFGGSMGGLLGLGLAAYAAEVLVFLVGMWFYQRVGYNARILFLAHFDWDIIKTSFKFGVFEMIGSAAPTATFVSKPR